MADRHSKQVQPESSRILRICAEIQPQRACVRFKVSANRAKLTKIHKSTYTLRTCTKTRFGKINKIHKNPQINLHPPYMHQNTFRQNQQNPQKSTNRTTSRIHAHQHKIPGSKSASPQIRSLRSRVNALAIASPTDGSLRSRVNVLASLRTACSLSLAQLACYRFATPAKSADSAFSVDSVDSAALRSFH